MSKVAKKVVRASIFLDEKLYAGLQKAAAKQGLSASRFISQLLTKSFSDLKSAKSTD